MTKKIDLLNIGLIALSLIIAIMLPFRLFLFSYAILGPLHYLTEINWLKDKNYFLSQSSPWVKLCDHCSLIDHLPLVYVVRKRLGRHARRTDVHIGRKG